MTNRATTLVSPKFLKASSLKALEKLMEKLIIRNAKQYDFYFFQQLLDGSHIVWYREEINFTYTKHLETRKK